MSHLVFLLECHLPHPPVTDSSCSIELQSVSVWSALSSSAALFYFLVAIYVIAALSRMKPLWGGEVFEKSFLQIDPCVFFLQVKMLWLVLFLPSVSSAQRSEPMFSSITKAVLPPDYDNNPTQLNYGVAVTDVDGDGDLEVFVAG